MASVPGPITTIQDTWSRWFDPGPIGAGSREPQEAASAGPLMGLPNHLSSPRGLAKERGKMQLLSWGLWD